MTITCPANIRQNAEDGKCSATVNFSVTAADNCLGVKVTSVPASGSAFPIGTTTITSPATNTSGNKASCTFTVTLVDNQPLTITSPTNVSVPATGFSARNVSLGISTRGGNCAVASVTNNAPSSYPFGTTTVPWTVADTSGNSASATQSVTVSGSQASSIASNFNGTKIAASDTLWFNAHISVQGVGANGAIIHFTGQSVTSKAFTAAVPDGSVVISPTATQATTEFSGGTWVTTVPLNYSGNIFVAGVPLVAPAGGYPSGLTPHLVRHRPFRPLPG